MQSIQEYAVTRAAAMHVALAEIPKERKYAREHVEALQAAGRSGKVIQQLMREGQSSRRINSEASLAEHAKSVDVDVLQAGLDKFCGALKTATFKHGKVSKVQHAAKSKPINELSAESQANATWEAIVSAMGRMADVSRPLSVQTLAGLLGRRLRDLCCGAVIEQELAYERAALLLLDHFGRSTGWLEERTGELRMMSKTRKPNTYILTQKFMDEILGGSLAIDFSERKPMLVPPVPWTTAGAHGGYLHAPVPAVRSTNKAIGSPAVVSALNALQSTAFRVNRRILELAEKHTNNAETLPGRMVMGKLMEARHDESADVQQAKTIRSALTIAAMRELQDEEEFYFPWNLDWRGRMYPATSIISPQGADLCKGCLEFADGTELGVAGADALAVHLCNLAGADKEIVGGQYRTRTPAERIEWTELHSPEIWDIGRNPEGNRAWHLIGGFGLTKIKRGKIVPVAVDKPWQFLAACFEWADFIEEGTGFKSRLAGALDGSCSGVQMLAGMTRDEKAGTMVNLVPAPRGDDYYGRMAQALDTRLQNLVDVADEKSTAYLGYWSGQTMDRDLLKLPSMTKVYSAGTYTFGEQVKNKSGAPEAEAMWLASQIDKCFSDVAPGMLKAMSYLQEVSDIVTDAGLPLCWTTPAGLTAEQARADTHCAVVSTQYAGPETRRSRRFRITDSTLNKKLQRSGVSPNFVHGVDASHMVMTINDLVSKGVKSLWMIHDSFGAPFADIDKVFRSTREQFVNLMSADLLQNWTDEVTVNLTDEQKATLPGIPEYGSLKLEQVRDSTYAWY
jgi:DNA-directed RNA polymerase